MARRGSRSHRVEGSSAAPNENARVETLDTLLEPLPALPVDPVSQLDNFLGPELPFDRRVFSIDPEPARGTVSRGHAVLSPEFSPVTFREDGVRAAVCVRRKERREVLFAKKRMRGRGGSRHRSWRSDVKC